VNTATELVSQVARLAQSCKVTTFYLNGAPGSGKSYLLKKAAILMPREVSNAQILGPYQIQPSEDAKLCEFILADCRSLGFLDNDFRLPPVRNLVDVWLSLGAQMQLRTRQQFIVLIDIDRGDRLDLPSLAALFSSARHLEGRWDEQHFGVHIVCAAYWDEPMLEAYYRHIQTSFPYSNERNSATWEGLAEGDLTALITESGHNGATPIQGRVLHELTGGHAAASRDVLRCVPIGHLSIATLLAATEQAASSGEAGYALRMAWQQLSPECVPVLKGLVLQRHMKVSPTDPPVISLIAAGAARLHTLGGKSYLEFRSWYSECLVRSHLDLLGLVDSQTRAIRRNELMPGIRCVNTDAYGLINETENAVRNFVATHLSAVTPDGVPILKGRCRRLNQNRLEDTYQRASDWMSRSRDKNLPADLNPLLAFCSTSDLAGLVREIADELRSPDWRAVSVAIEDLSEIRNSVMHNQMIDDCCLDRLHALKARVWDAVSRTSLPSERTQST
jgi:hypothetical protein